jgi:type IV pilus assembly protein PilC
MKFNYKAIRADGTAETATAEALDRFALAREMHARGLTLVKAEAIDQAAERPLPWYRHWLTGWRPKDLIIFAGSLSSMIGAGLSLSRALEVLGRQVKNRYFKKIIASLVEKVNRGEALSQALAAWPTVFPPVFVAMVAAGEESGNLAKSLEIVRDQLAKNYDLRRRIKGAMIYPAIVLSLVFVIGALMMIFLVPNLSSLFKELEVELPLSTKLVIMAGDFLAAHYALVALGALALVAGVVKLARTTRGRRALAHLWLHLPVISTIAKELNAAVTMRTLSSLIAAGVNLVEALGITGKVLQNPHYREVLAEAGERVQKGSPLSAVFRDHEKIYPILVGELTEVGEETGNLSGMLLKGAVFFEEEVDQATKNLSTFIEPALMVLIGIVVGFFAISMLGPMYSLTDAL